MSGLRWEVWHNGHTRAIARHGEQDIEYRVDPPDKWSVAFSHPIEGECFIIKHFPSVKERKEYINKFQDWYEERGV